MPVPFSLNKKQKVVTLGRCKNNVKNSCTFVGVTNTCKIGSFD